MREMDACAIARGEAQWTNGYRAAKGALIDTTPEGARLYAKEMDQWNTVSHVERRFYRLALKALRDAVTSAAARRLA
jgi:hypothetical protein